MFALEWPPKSSELRSFPEMDKAEWFDLDQARRPAITGEHVFIRLGRVRIYHDATKLFEVAAQQPARDTAQNPLACTTIPSKVSPNKSAETCLSGRDHTPRASSPRIFGPTSSWNGP